MKVTCPTCHEVIPAEGIALDAGWAKCGRCNEVVRLSEILPGYTGAVAPEPVPERPFDARIVVERTKEKLIVHVPAQGMRGQNWGLLAFSVFWLSFIAFWTAGALGVIGPGPIRWGNVAFAAFSTPFWGIGFAMLGGAVWSARNSRTMYLSASWLFTEQRCGVWRRRKRIARSLVQCARNGTAAGWRRGQRSGRYADEDYSGVPVYCVELVFEKGIFRLPCNSEAERQWLVADINDFLRSAPYTPPTPLDEYVEQNSLLGRP